MNGQSESGGVIVADAIYTLPEFQRRTGLGESAMRNARDAGLKVLRLSRRGFVKGSDAIEFIGRVGTKQR